MKTKDLFNVSRTLETLDILSLGTDGIIQFKCYSLY